MSRLIGMARRQVTAADEAHRLTQANMRAGTMTTLDVLQAQDAVAQARLRYAEAVVRYNQAEVNLLAAIGLLDRDALIAAQAVVQQTNDDDLGGHSEVTSTFGSPAREITKSAS